eukprot:TRINITY_DN3864_c0_g1_i6.p1 TRINITY_DN3864_c0_g1~~TRINITY_DN3864_c0_g1_i6.p1  ORF type:complete len:1363 (+),score=308.95 TRINITY_DN3864_c0_g1_i6:85-4089(+)
MPPELPSEGFSCSVWRDNLVLFGGKAGSGDLLGAVWHAPAAEAWGEGAAAAPAQVQLSALPCTGPVPAARCYHTAHIYGDDLVIVHGLVREVDALHSRSVPVLDLAAGEWRALPCSGAVPPSRCHHASALSGDSVLMVGGFALAPAGEDEAGLVYELSLPAMTWRQVSTGGVGEAPRLWGHIAVHWEDKLVLHGGVDTLMDSESDAVHFWDRGRREWRSVDFGAAGPAAHAGAEATAAPAQLSPPRHGAAAAATVQLRALHSFAATDQRQLSFTRGTLLEAAAPGPGDGGHELAGWRRARLDGREGWVPQNYVEELPQTPVLPAAQLTASRLLTAADCGRRVQIAETGVVVRVTQRGAAWGWKKVRVGDLLPCETAYRPPASQSAPDASPLSADLRRSPQRGCASPRADQHPPAAPVSRSSHAGAAVDGWGLLVWGGERGEPSRKLGDAWVLDLRSGEWQRIAADGAAPPPAGLPCVWHRGAACIPTPAARTLHLLDISSRAWSQCLLVVGPPRALAAGSPPQRRLRSASPAPAPPPPAVSSCGAPQYAAQDGMQRSRATSPPFGGGVHAVTTPPSATELIRARYTPGRAGSPQHAPPPTLIPPPPPPGGAAAARNGPVYAAPVLADAAAAAPMEHPALPGGRRSGGGGGGGGTEPIGAWRQRHFREGLTSPPQSAPPAPAESDIFFQAHSPLQQHYQELTSEPTAFSPPSADRRTPTARRSPPPSAPACSNLPSTPPIPPHPWAAAAAGGGPRRCSAREEASQLRPGSTAPPTRRSSACGLSPMPPDCPPASQAGTSTASAPPPPSEPPPAVPAPAPAPSTASESGHPPSQPAAGADECPAPPTSQLTDDGLREEIARLRSEAAAARAAQQRIEELLTQSGLGTEVTAAQQRCVEALVQQAAAAAAEQEATSAAQQRCVEALQRHVDEIRGVLSTATAAAAAGGGSGSATPIEPAAGSALLADAASGSFHVGRPLADAACGSFVVGGGVADAGTSPHQAALDPSAAGAAARELVIDRGTADRRLGLLWQGDRLRGVSEDGAARNCGAEAFVGRRVTHCNGVRVFDAGGVRQAATGAAVVRLRFRGALLGESRRVSPPRRTRTASPRQRRAGSAPSGTPDRARALQSPLPPAVQRLRAAGRRASGEQRRSNSPVRRTASPTAVQQERRRSSNIQQQNSGIGPWGSSTPPSASPRGSPARPVQRAGSAARRASTPQARSPSPATSARSSTGLRQDSGRPLFLPNSARPSSPCSRHRRFGSHHVSLVVPRPAYAQPTQSSAQRRQSFQRGSMGPQSRGSVGGSRSGSPLLRSPHRQSPARAPRAGSAMRAPPVEIT